MNGSERAYAKLNLCLEVTERLPDGYHGIRSIMQSVAFHDSVSLESGGTEWVVRSDLSYLPTGETNLAARAARLFREVTGQGPEGGVIRLKKRIPVCGGFGGGSSDAAAVLRLLNRLCGCPLSWEELESISLRLGADVPFCIRGGTMLAEGKGERLTPLAPFAGQGVVLCRPEFSCSTPELFRAIDRQKQRLRPDVAGMEKAILAGDVRGVGQRLFNVFEAALSRKQSETVWELRDALLDSGALGAVMTGSGSGVFGLYPSPAAAQAALPRLREQGIECHATQTTERLGVLQGGSGQQSVIRGQ